MKVFISWSGSKSEAVAVALRDWLPGVINSLEPFVSAKDIYAGTRWQSEIASQLDVSNFGIVCVTRENQAAPWLNFEAGALAKAVDLSRLIPLAVDLKPSDVKVPLGQFQAQPATEDGIRAVVASLNDALGEQRLQDELLRTSFDVWWQRLETKLATIEEQTSAAEPPLRTDRELLEEAVNTVRAVALAIDRAGFRSRRWEDRLPFDITRNLTSRALEALPSLESRVLILRFGLDDDIPRTLKAIGETLGMSPERVRQLESQALQRLAGLSMLGQLSEPDNEAS
jgi:hypothetical protein